jgi:AcrR family transcriptional regulator
MGSKERREREKAITRELILDAARELFVLEGYDHVTMRKIAERIEYSPTAIYLHFADKEALMTELSACDFHQFALAVMAVPRDLDPAERLRRLGRALVAFALENRNQYRLLFMTPRPIQHDKADPGDTAYFVLVEAVRAAMEAGAIHPAWTDLEVVAQCLWGALHGVVSLHIVMPDGGKVGLRPIEQLVETQMDLLLRGFAEPPSPRLG